MWGYMNDYLRGILLLSDEEILKKKKRKNEGGGLIFLGASLVIMGIAHQMFLGIMYDSRVLLAVISAVVIILGIVSLFFGFRIVNQIGKSVAEFWAEENGYTVDEMLAFNRECHMDSAIAVHSDYWSETEKPADCIEDMKKENALSTGYITDNWFKEPSDYGGAIMRIIDIAAIWHEARARVLKGREPGVFYVKSNAEQGYFMVSEGIGNWIVKEIQSHNPMVITDSRFQMDDIIYDAYKEPEKVAELYRMECAKRRGQA